LKLKIEEKENLLKKLQEEYSDSEKYFNTVLKEKDFVIENLKRELEIVKCEKNENYNKMQNLFKEMGVNVNNESKFAIFNRRKGVIIYYFKI
jgi:hypothetical protein